MQTSPSIFQGIEGGTIPLTVMFSGTTFYRTPARQLQAVRRYAFKVRHGLATFDEAIEAAVQ